MRTDKPTATPTATERESAHHASDGSRQAQCRAPPRVTDTRCNRSFIRLAIATSAGAVAGVLVGAIGTALLRGDQAVCAPTAPGGISSHRPAEDIERATYIVGSSLAPKVVVDHVQRWHGYGPWKDGDYGWLGVELREPCAGAEIAEIPPDSVVQETLRVGDVILEFDGRKVPRPAALSAFVAGTPPGRVVPIRLRRGHEDLAVQVKLGAMLVRFGEDTVSEPGTRVWTVEPHKDGLDNRPGDVVLKFSEAGSFRIHRTYPTTK